MECEFFFYPGKGNKPKDTVLVLFLDILAKQKSLGYYR